MFKAPDCVLSVKLHYIITPPAPDIDLQKECSLFFHFNGFTRHMSKGLILSLA